MKKKKKKNSLILSRYLWWPLARVANWIGSFINQCPLEKKTFQSPYIQGHPWPKKIGQIKRRLRGSATPKGSPHAETIIFNHPRR